MTGEMVEVDLEKYPFHATIADELNGEVKPFDKYQGPEIRIGSATLWIVHDGNGPPFVYREGTDEQSERFTPYVNGETNTEQAVACARSLFTDEELDRIAEF